MTAIWFAAIFLIQLQLPDQVQPGAVTGRLLSVTWYSGRRHPNCCGPRG